MPASLLPSSLGGVSSQELRRRLEPITIPSSSPKATFTNWGLSFTCQPSVVFEPETDEQCEWICELARREGRTVRAAGMGHSPSDLACTSEFMLRTNKLDKIVEVSLGFPLVIFFLSVRVRSARVANECHGWLEIVDGVVNTRTKDRKFRYLLWWCAGGDRRSSIFVINFAYIYCREIDFRVEFVGLGYLIKSFFLLTPCLSRQ